MGEIIVMRSLDLSASRTHWWDGKVKQGTHRSVWTMACNVMLWDAVDAPGSPVTCGECLKRLDAIQRWLAREAGYAASADTALLDETVDTRQGPETEFVMVDLKS